MEINPADISKLMILKRDMRYAMGYRFKSLRPFKSNLDLGNFMFTSFFNILFKSQHKDILCCAKVFYKSDLKGYDIISNEFDIDIKNLGLKDLIYLIIDQRYYKKDSSIRYLIFELIEFYLRYNLNSKFSTYNYFIRKIENLKRFNLDQESFFLELKSKMLNE